MRQCASLLLVVSSTLAWAPHRRPAGSRTALRSTLSPDRASILARRFWEVDMQTRKRIDRVLEAFRAERLDASAFNGVDGYGYGDVGREKLDGVVARLMGAEAALVRLQLFSGTHAISCALFGALRPGDAMLGVSGPNYDTLEEVIGLRGSESTGGTTRGSLRDWGVAYDEVPLAVGGGFDLEAIDAALAASPAVRLVHVQRSCGYQWRPSIPVAEIARLCRHLDAHPRRRELVVFVDNCYGELVEDQEPCSVGADLVAGSLIKNLGGTIARAGGYIAGRRELVDAAAVHLSAPGVTGGATLGQCRTMFHGLFLAPSIIGEVREMAHAHDASIRVTPPSDPPSSPSRAPSSSPRCLACSAGLRATLRQARTAPISSKPSSSAIAIGSCASVRCVVCYRCSEPETTRAHNDTCVTRAACCQAVQRMSPVDAHVRPVPGVTPGYGHEVIFADGTFIEGSTLELSADGPLREPFVVYSQGCTHWTHWDLVLTEAMKTLD